MKKFLLILFILIIIAGTGFFMGWTHITVPPGSFGVMISKTHGLEPAVIRDGEFSWLWYKVIPTNAEVFVFNINPVRWPIRSTGALLSGDTYLVLAGLNADFGWEISGDLRFNIKPELLPELVSRNHIRNNEDLALYEEELARRIESMILARIRDISNTADEIAMDNMLFTGSLPGMEAEIQRSFPEIENIHCIFNVIRMPDFELYHSVRAIYREYIDTQRIFLNDEVLREAQNRIAARIRIDLLSQYGEVMTRFPILLEFLNMDSIIVRDFLSIGD